MKYIDADKLIAEIERLKERAEHYNEISLTWREKDYWCGESGALELLTSFITSLQQEQVDTAGDDGKFFKILVRREFAEQIQRLGDEIQAGQSSFIEAMNQQEQPEVDLEKAFAHEYAIYHLPTFIIASIDNGTELIDFIYKTARHFYELGLKARKEN